MRFKVDCDFLLLLVTLKVIEAKERIWRFDSDISNSANWLDGKLAVNCKGIHFAPINTAPVYIHDLTTPEITLPSDGVLEILEGGSVEFKDNKKCIKLKPLNYHDWYDYDSWQKTEDNVAIPHLERIPCTGDDVVFPGGLHTRVFENFGAEIQVGSIKLGTNTVRSFAQILQDQGDLFISPLDTFRLLIMKQSCKDPYGCLCHEEFVPCPSKEKPKLPCLNPIEPENFCEEICGAYVTYKPGTGPHLDEIEKKIKEYAVDTYASRVKDYLGNQVIQVVFSEKDYTGASLEEAESFRQYLDGFNVKSAQIFKSGEYFVEGGSKTTVGLVFGTLAAVLMFFGLVFYLHDHTSINVIISTFRQTRAGSVFNVPFFARFDNTDENLIIEESENSSILDIAKSFDNPMYGHTGSSSSTQHENPLYDVAKEKNVEVEE